MAVLANHNLADACWISSSGTHEIGPDTLSLIAEAGTDFWVGTHFGFAAFSGHALQLPLDGNAAAEVTVDADFVGQYDQLGLLLSSDDTHWVKLSLEQINGRLRIVCVVTNGQSDSALCPYRGAVSRAVLRLSRRGDAVVAEWRSPDEDRFEVIRLAPLPGTGPFRLGPMACAPKSTGFAARFSGFRLGPPTAGEVDA